MRSALLAYCLGLLSLGYPLLQAADISAVIKPALAGLLLLSIAAFVTSRGRGSPGGFRLLLNTSCFAAGILWHGLWANGILQQRLPFELEGIDLLSEGVIVSLPQRNSLSQQFEFQITHSDAGFSQRKVLLNYYGGETVEPGQRWRFLLRLNRPHGFANPGGFDYEAWLFQRGISAKGYIRTSVSNELLPDRNCTSSCRNSLLSLTPAKALLSSARFRLRRKLLDVMQDSRYSGIILALVLGDRSHVEAADWQRLTDSGSNHLFVISGLHIGMIAGFCFSLTRSLLRLFPRIGLWVPMQKLSALMAILAAVIYALLAGLSLPTQRALVMIVVFMLGQLANRRYLVSFRFVLALAIVLSLNPLAALNAGFWFSFIAVGALLMCMDAGVAAPDVDTEVQARFERAKSFATKTYRYMLRPQLIVFFALLVPLVFWTQQLSLLAPLVNVVAIPLVGFVVVPLCLLGLVLLSFTEAFSHGCLLLAEFVLTGFFECLQWLLQETDSWAVIQLGSLHPWQFISSAVAVRVLLLPRGIINRGLIIPLSLPLLLPPPPQGAVSEEGVIKLHILDVGQGLAVIVQTARHSLVYDTGANLSAEFNMGAAVLVPVLRTLAINKLDRIVISHGDNDHAGGLSGLLSAIPADAIYSSTAQLNTEQVILPCSGGQRWNWDGVEFRFLSMAADTLSPSTLSPNNLSPNNNSCVLQLLSGKNSVLLPGDIEAQTERKLALKYAKGLRATIIVAPHHGSKTSSSYSLLKNVNPDYVVFSSGYQNSFNHPSEQIVTRYTEFAAIPLATAKSGMISFTVKPQVAIEMPRQYRAETSRYWH